jgi:hypothetical protein
MQDDMGLNIIIEDGIPKLLFKIPGSDVNPYLCIFSALSSVGLFLFRFNVVLRIVYL